MRWSEWLLLGTCALGVYGVGNVWLVQLSSYPLWRYVGPQEFRAYHLVWWHSIWGPVLAPAIFAFAGAVLMLWWRAPHVPAWAPALGIVLQLSLVLGTALWWGPLMARLEAPQGALALARYRLLMDTHWLRVAIVTAYGLLLLWMVAKSGWSGSGR